MNRTPLPEHIRTEVQRIQASLPPPTEGAPLPPNIERNAVENTRQRRSHSPVESQIRVRLQSGGPHPEAPEGSAYRGRCAGPG